MRLWHHKLLPYLPELQFKGQLRETVAIMRDIRDRGGTNNLLINRVMSYPKADLSSYFWDYDMLYHKRFSVQHKGYMEEFIEFADYTGYNPQPFEGWHNKEYLRVCVCNLFEKYYFGIGKSKISQEEWDRVLQGYREITGEEWKL